MIFRIVKFKLYIILNIKYNSMEHSEKMPVTPRFGISKDNNVLFEKGLGKTIPNCSKDIIQCNKNIEKFKNTKNEKSKPK